MSAASKLTASRRGDPPPCSDVGGRSKPVSAALQHRPDRGSPVHVVARGRTGRRGLVLMRWGLLPVLGEGPEGLSAPSINARSEERRPEKPAFRAAPVGAVSPCPRRGSTSGRRRGRAKGPAPLSEADWAARAAGMAETWCGAERRGKLDTVAVLTRRGDRGGCRVSRQDAPHGAAVGVRRGPLGPRQRERGTGRRRSASPSARPTRPGRCLFGCRTRRKRGRGSARARPRPR